MDLTLILSLLPGLVIGLTLHEFAHAWSASLLGDDFSRRAGRVSLNPFRHLSLTGVAALFFIGFGWGRPVMVNIYHFKRPRFGYLLTSLAGPAANAVVVGLCLAAMLLTARTRGVDSALGRGGMLLAHASLMQVALINALLGVFNLLPVPPLDGSKIWPCIIPGLKPSMKLKTTGLFMIILVVLLMTGRLHPMVGTVLGAVRRLAPISDIQRSETLVGRAKQAVTTKDYAQAEELAAQALAADPYSDQAWYWRGTAKTWQANWTGALEDMNRAIDLDADNPTYYRVRGRILKELGRDQASSADYARATTLTAARQAARRATTQSQSQPSSQKSSPL